MSFLTKLLRVIGMDVRMPDGTIVKNVPEGTTKSELLERYRRENNLVNMVKEFEKFRAKAYLPTKNDRLTIGYGFTDGVKEGDTITEEEADRRLRKELKHYRKELRKVVKVKLKPHQEDALVSLVYNVGISAFKKSRALKYLNNGNVERFLEEAFSPKKGFVYQKGKKLKGLVRRRAFERKIFTEGWK